MVPTSEQANQTKEKFLGNFGGYTYHVAISQRKMWEANLSPVEGEEFCIVYALRTTAPLDLQLPAEYEGIRVYYGGRGEGVLARTGT